MLTPDDRQIRTFGPPTVSFLLLPTGWLVEGRHCGYGEHRRVLEADLQSLEHEFELVVANARHIKAVPGRKTDIKQTHEWIAGLLMRPAEAELHPRSTTASARVGRPTQSGPE